MVLLVLSVAVIFVQCICDFIGFQSEKKTLYVTWVYKTHFTSLFKYEVGNSLDLSVFWLSFYYYKNVLI